MKLAIFPGSFDPFTNGHLEVVQQGLNLFDKLIVAIGINLQKKSFFSVEERIAMIQEAVKDSRCQVMAFDGLVVEFAKKQGARSLIRGLRTESDFSYEMPMAMTNKILAKDITTVFFPTSQESQYLSSSLVREVASHGGDVSAFVPSSVMREITSKLKESRPG